MNCRNYRKVLIKILSWSAVFLWMILIFILSSQAAFESNQLTNGIAKTIVNSIKTIMPDVSLDTISFNHIVRKNSHFLIYCFLGILLSITLKVNGVHKYQTKGLVLLVCALYAGLDEFHQMFVPGRGPGIKDVCIDCAGAVAGIVIYEIIANTLLKNWKYVQRHNRRLNKKQVIRIELQNNQGFESTEDTGKQ